MNEIQGSKSESFPQPITAEEARTVSLSLNPFRRLGQLAEYGDAFHLKKAGMSPLPLYLTRGDLVRTAEAREHAFELLAIADSLPEEDN